LQGRSPLRRQLPPFVPAARPQLQHECAGVEGCSAPWQVTCSLAISVKVSSDSPDESGTPGTASTDLRSHGHQGGGLDATCMSSSSSSSSSSSVARGVQSTYASNRHPTASLSAPFISSRPPLGTPACTLPLQLTAPAFFDEVDRRLAVAGSHSPPRLVISSSAPAAPHTDQHQPQPQPPSRPREELTGWVRIQSSDGFITRNS
jgi:hypothetical protein